MGPFFVTRDEIQDLRNVSLTLRVNKKLRQEGNSKSMIRGFGDLLLYPSTELTFYPGDILSGGTCKGTGLDLAPRDQNNNLVNDDLFLKHGDTIEATVEHIGT